MKCPICDNEINEIDARCINCGFNDFRYDFKNQEEAFDYITKIIIPCRKYWEVVAGNEKQETKSSPQNKAGSNIEKNYVNNKSEYSSGEWRSIIDIDNDGVVIVSYTGNNRNVRIPSIIGNKKVVGLGDRLFCGYDEILSIELPSYLKMIGKSAFENCRIKSIKIPESCVEIGESAFLGTDIEEITFPKGIEIIEKSVCKDCHNLTSVRFTNAKNIKAEAFNNCNKLRNIIVPEGVKKISFNALPSSLESLELPCSLQVFAFKDSLLSKSSCKILFRCDNVMFSTQEQNNSHGFENIFDMFTTTTNLNPFSNSYHRAPVFFCNAGSNAYKYARNYKIMNLPIDDYYDAITK